ncbi:hypothetical protein DERP_003825 [Dermatophagoides pteronyssinus]|uniref:Uncharacterized protein n=2 Tax=Dermatophagoides pteronyssinus TaxID=6956 RepID=A0ABQ8JLQ6_DERPT|nr:vesicular inhibitory amino acid transporter-like [Dermatophagoides pteronyssinus]KAH9423544.1 hypothetical protein DERP_003825 [Dermatophagoides pteronyssinus]
MNDKVSNLVNQWSSLKERVRSKIPESCTEAVDKIRGRRGDEHEMGTFRTFEPTNQMAGDGGFNQTIGSGFVEYQEGANGYYEGQQPPPPHLSYDPHTGTSGKISAWQAGWNITNAIQGMFIVCLPYAVLHGGYWGVFVLVFVAYICFYTGRILVHCLYEPNEQGQMIRVRDSYVKIAEACLGEKYGGILVNTAQIIELLMTCILYVVLSGDLMIGSFPEGVIDQRSWMMISTMLLLPCAFLTNLHSVSTLSFWCTVTHIILNVIILGYCLIQIGDWQWSKVTLRLDMGTFPITLGIVVFSYTSQIFLPTLEGNMQNPDEFEEMLKWSHIAAGLSKALFALIGFLTFGEETQDVITNNLPTRGFRGLVNLTLVTKALLSYPLPYFAAASLIESALFRSRPTEQRPDGEGDQPFPTCWGRDNELRVWAVTLRVLLVLFTMFMAVSIPHFVLLMGLIGNFTGTMLSFVWPCYFHMKLKWHTLDIRHIAWEVFIICCGILCGIIGIITSFTALVETYHIPLPYPDQNALQG